MLAKLGLVYQLPLAGQVVAAATLAVVAVVEPPDSEGLSPAVVGVAGLSASVAKKVKLSLPCDQV